MSKFTEPFTKMAEDIERIPEDSFGAAVVIKFAREDSLPDGAEIKFMIVGTQDAAQVTAMVQARLKMLIDSMTQMFQGRR